eukprot:gb/GEZN01002198.1/.p1 GENE.gb/GEZN01002198.1/~~gb/GEZN01002198.1/.p1  ORF type:complete len:769 (-),score=107.45 gb/GEZN01002198.1/:264-2570(-)
MRSATDATPPSKGTQCHEESDLLQRVRRTVQCEDGGHVNPPCQTKPVTRRELAVRLRRHPSERPQYIKVITPWYQEKDSLRFFAMFFLTATYLLIEVIWGTLLGSLTLLADALHMLSDLIALVIGFYALQQGKKVRNSGATYGYGRMEVVGGLVNGVFLLAMTFSLVMEAITRFFTGPPDTLTDPDASKTLLIVASIGLFINLMGLFIFSHEGHGHSHGGSDGAASRGRGPRGHLKRDYGEDHAHGQHAHAHGAHGHTHKTEGALGSSTSAVVDQGLDMRRRGSQDLDAPSQIGYADEPNYLDDLGRPLQPNDHLGNVHTDDPDYDEHAPHQDDEHDEHCEYEHEHEHDEHDHEEHSDAEHHGHGHGADEDGHGHSHGGTSGHGHSHGGAKPHTVPPLESKHDSTRNFAESTSSSHGHAHGALTTTPPPLIPLSSPSPSTVSPASQKDKHHKASSSFAHGHAHGDQNLNIHAVYLHIMGDALGSVAVIISALVMRYASSPHRFLVDPLCTLLITAIIWMGSLPLVKQTSAILLQKVPESIQLETLQEEILLIPGVHEIHELHVWLLTKRIIVCSVHVTMENSQDFSRICEGIKKLMHAHGIHTSTIQPEFVELSDHHLKEKDHCNEILCEEEICHTNYCCPPGVPDADDELRPFLLTDKSALDASERKVRVHMTPGKVAKKVAIIPDHPSPSSAIAHRVYSLDHPSPPSALAHSVYSMGSSAYGGGVGYGGGTTTAYGGGGGYGGGSGGQGMTRVQMVGASTLGDVSF